MHRKKYIRLCLIVPAMLLLAACGTAARVVESYLDALVNKDGNTLSTLSCADWEQSALMELDSFQAVDLRLDGLVCADSGMDGDSTLVSCSGKIIATYDGEDQEFDLSSRKYQVVQQGGDYLVCGYQ